MDAWLKTRSGATAIEYALIASGIAMAIAAVVFLIGGDIAGMFQDLRDQLAAHS